MTRQRTNHEIPCMTPSIVAFRMRPRRRRARSRSPRWSPGSAVARRSSPNSARITPNYKDADLGQVVEAVSQVTGRSFILDPRVRAQVTMLSTTPMSPDAFYEAFLAILQVHGFIAVPAGNVIKILPDANARQLPANDLPDRVSSTSDEIVTQVIQVRNVSAAQLVPILRPLMPQYGAPGGLPVVEHPDHLGPRVQREPHGAHHPAHRPGERRRHRDRQAAERLGGRDRAGRELPDAGPGQAEAGGQSARVVADDRSNSVLLSGEKSQRLRARSLIAFLDTPLANGGDTQVRYLRYADAEKIAPKLKEQLAVTQAGQQGVRTAAGAAAAADRQQTSIWADPRPMRW